VWNQSRKPLRFKVLIYADRGQVESGAKVGGSNGRELTRHNPGFICDMICPVYKMTAHSAARGFQLKPRHCTFATFLVCLAIIPICNSYPTSVWPLETVAKSASVLATVKVGHVSPPGSQPESVYRTVPGHVELVVLRSFPPSAMKADEHIQLDFETLPAGNSGMNGPDVAYFEEGMILIVPLKPNPRPATDACRLFADVGGGIVIPAIERGPTFPGHAKSGREYLLQ
jgi:hypothetical protein